MYIRNGLPFNVDAPFTGADGTQYPAGFFKGADADTLAAAGITEVADPVYKDDRYYVNSPGADGEIISVAKPLEQVLQSVFAKIQAHRDQLTQTGGFKVADKWFHSDVFSRTQFLGLSGMGSAIPAGLKWKTMDGTFVDMTPELASQVFQAAAAQDIAIFAACESHKATLQAATDVEEVAGYDWTAGWPEVFVKAAAE